ncbi:hypothetical protein [Nocardia sp. XZ_19_369]|uniref:hypothetical protein n=1 Tax=Nocardia sp. XZ_19_369 TaxID=2769487 RepID=UPI001890742B|nr:hypothetical protein [Nocardia sp. XZ_19_369]
MLQTHQQSTAASYHLVLAQLTRAARAVRDAHTAMDELHRATELDRVMRSELVAVHSRYTSSPVDHDRQMSARMQRVIEGAIEFGPVSSVDSSYPSPVTPQDDRPDHDHELGLDQSEDYGQQR